LLHELIPSAQILVLLVNPTNPNADTILRDLEAAAHNAGVEARILSASKDGEFEEVFAKIAEMPASALVIGADVSRPSRFTCRPRWVLLDPVP
jgi:putative ABC transport system substrate-binding protein